MEPGRKPEAAEGTDAIERARAAYARRAWAEAHRAFALADGRTPLASRDLEAYMWAAALTGRDDDHVLLLERIYQQRVEAGEETGAARAAFWLGMHLFMRREAGRASAWLARAERLSESSDCVERGYLLLPTVHRNLGSGDLEAASVTAGEAV